jgi:uncharacterized protein (DUF1778 family)
MGTKQASPFGVRLTPDERQLLQGAATLHGVTESELAREAILDKARALLIDHTASQAEEES